MDDVRDSMIAGEGGRAGARFGPQAVRAGSKLLRPYHPALDVHPWRVHQVADAGDIGVNPLDLPEAVAQIESGARDVLTPADRLVTLGGDDTIALPLLRVLAEQHGPIALVHFDAHLTPGTPTSARRTRTGRRSAGPPRRACRRSTASGHVGIRAPLYAQSDLDRDRSLGFAAFTDEEVARRGTDAVVDRVRELVGDRPVYISIDVDVLDPAPAPGTGTPEPGGLTSRELQMVLRGLDGLQLVGGDVVEVAPAYDHAALAAAAVAYDVLGLLALQAGRA